MYGVFGVVLGLLAWLYLQAQFTLYAVEANVVSVRRLWPRSLAPPPFTPEDLRAFDMYAKMQERRREQDIETQVAAPSPADRRSGAPAETVPPRTVPPGATHPGTAPARDSAAGDNAPKRSPRSLGR